MAAKSSTEYDGGYAGGNRRSHFLSDGSDYIVEDSCPERRRVWTLSRTESDCYDTCGHYKFDKGQFQKHDLMLSDELEENSLLRKALKRAKNTARKRYMQPGVLYENQLMAILAYTAETPKLYESFNKETRKLKIGHPRYCYRYEAFHFFLESAVHRLCKKETQVVYRYVDYLPDVKAKQFFWFPNMTSTSLHKSQVEDFGPHCFQIHTKKGANISEFSVYPEEAEVLIPTCETFEVSAVEYQ